MKKLQIPATELKVLLNTVQEITEKRSAASKSEAMDDKPNVDYRVCKRLLTGVSDSVSSKIRKVVESSSSSKSPSKSSESTEQLVDEEAVERVKASESEMTETSTNIKDLRSQVLLKQQQCSALEASTREAIESRVEEEHVAEELDESLDTSTNSVSVVVPANLTEVKASLSSLSERLLTLAKQMPTKMEGFEQTLDSVNTGLSESGEGGCEVHDAIRGVINDENKPVAENKMPVVENKMASKSPAKSPAAAAGTAEDAFADFMAR
jgi:hypothetical protein